MTVRPVRPARPARASRRAHRGRPALAAAAVLALLALAPGAAQAQDGGAPRPAAPTATASAKVKVEDIYGEVMTVDEPSFQKPASGFSLGGSGGKGQKLKEVHVWKGAHEILVPVERITRIDVGKPCDTDLVEVRLTLAGGEKLEGKVDRDLELHGKVQYGLYRISFERLKSIVFRA